MVKATLFQNLLKATSIDTITPAMILQAGAPIFFDLANNPDLKAVSTVVDAYRGVHAPLYGQPIPLTGLISSGEGNKTILQPSSNEVRRVIAISATNAGGAPIEFDLKLGAMIISTGVVGPVATVPATPTGSTIYSSKNLPLSVIVTSGDAGDLTTTVASILTSQ
tara:strand:- start:453 stop:947 length:495 start_codon:yes stop_codon:yes gene_type:complete